VTVHKLLERQIKRYLGDSVKLSPELSAFIAAVDDAYNSADADRLMIERSLDLMSQELTDANAGLRSQLVERQRTEMALLKEKDEQRILIRKLEDIHSQLLQSEKMASIGQLAAGIAHEINNPIGYVYSNLGTLEKYVQDGLNMLDQYEQAENTIADPEVKSRIQAARQKLDIAFVKTDLRSLMGESKEGIVRVKAIVQNLKDFSHVGTSEEWQVSDLHKGLDSTLLIVNNELKYKAEVVREYGHIPNVECLLPQLNQVFMNLLVNAAHAIVEHGTITVRTGMEGNEVWVDVIDTGQGIPPENLKKIFDPFFTTKPVGKGTGLGLSVSYGIVKKHHGRMEVHSEVGKGSSFRVWLPVSQPRT
jgi:two-component system, NtrC family, sensor kinase